LKVTGAELHCPHLSSPVLTIRVFVAIDEGKTKFPTARGLKLEEQSVTHTPVLFKGVTISGQWKVLLSVSVVEDRYALSLVESM
jgi:hypothetical protein